MALSAEYLKQRTERDRGIRLETSQAYQDFGVGEALDLFQEELKKDGVGFWRIESFTNPYWKYVQILWKNELADRKINGIPVVAVWVATCSNRVEVSVGTMGHSAGAVTTRWFCFENANWHPDFVREKSSSGETSRDTLLGEIRYGAWLADRFTDEDWKKYSTVILQSAA